MIFNFQSTSFKCPLNLINFDSSLTPGFQPTLFKYPLKLLIKKQNLVKRDSAFLLFL